MFDNQQVVLWVLFDDQQHLVHYHYISDLLTSGDADPETTFVLVKIPSLLSDVQARSRKLTDIPGYSTTGERSFKLEVLQAGDPRLLGIGPQARLVINGISITEMRRRLGGEEGHISGPGGKKYYLSLEPWSGVDPDTTFLQPTFFPENRPKA